MKITYKITSIVIGLIANTFLFPTAVKSDMNDLIEYYNRLDDSSKIQFAMTLGSAGTLCELNSYGYISMELSQTYRDNSLSDDPRQYQIDKKAFNWGVQLIERHLDGKNCNGLEITD